jgi:hypothetical protein
MKDGGVDISDVHIITRGARQYGIRSKYKWKKQYLGEQSRAAAIKRQA